MAIKRLTRLVLLIQWLTAWGLCTGSEAKLITKIAEHAPGQIIVKLKPKDNASPKTTQSVVVSALLKKLGEGSVLSIKPFQTDSSLHVIRLSKTSDEDLNTAIETLKLQTQVQYAEPDYTLRTLDDGVPNDPDFDKTWGLRNTGQKDPGGSLGLSGSDINVLPLWKEGITGSKKVVVAVIDTGIDWTHPDIQANLYTNPGEIPGNGLDNDHNGFVQDIHGWNFYDDSPNSMDDHNHGTHCAGTIGAVGNNGTGIAGINWNVSLMPIKFLSSSGSGNLSKAVEAINYARMMKVNVMNNSWGGGGFTQTMYDSIKNARDAGILFVVAAGNDGHDNDEQPSYPASYDLENILSVAATDNKDSLGLFSNYGARSVHVAAPGVRIWSTIRGGEYGSLSGTSMSAPHASGVAALLLSTNPTMNYVELKNRMIKTSTPVPGLRGKVLSKGRLNAYNAVHGIIEPPREPSREPDPGQNTLH
jgi:thermitase